MRRSILPGPCLSSACCLILFTIAAFAQHGARKVGPPAGKVRPERAPGGMDTKVERLQQMTPEERERALQSLPPDRRQRVEARLDNLNKLTPEQRAKLRERWEKFKNLPPQQQQLVRQMARALQELPQDRRAGVRKELRRLQKMPESERALYLESPDVKQNFTPQEQRILKESAAVLPEEM